MSIDDGFQVDLYLRSETSPAVAEQQQRVRSRLERSSPPGTFTVHEHPKRVAVTGETSIVDRYEAVCRWAAETGVSLSPFFEHRDSYDPDADAVREMVVLPVLWLTLSDERSVRASYPHVDGEVATVSEAVSEFGDVDGERASDAAD